MFSVDGEDVQGKRLRENVLLVNSFRVGVIGVIVIGVPPLGGIKCKSASTPSCGKIDGRGPNAKVGI